MKKNICYILLRKMSQITYFSWVNLKMLIWNNWQIARMTMTMTYQDGLRIVGGPILVRTCQWKAQIGNIQSFWELHFNNLSFPTILATHTGPQFNEQNVVQRNLIYVYTLQMIPVYFCPLQGKTSYLAQTA